MKHILLKLLPIPKYIWGEILLDFIIELLLPSKLDYKNITNCLVITNWLIKGMILINIVSTTIKALVYIFLIHVYMYYRLPHIVVSNRESQFVNGF